MTEPTKKQIQKWVRALRSGKYGQGRKALQSAENKFCCLGVAVKKFMPKKEQDLIGGLLHGGIIGDQIAAPSWLFWVNGNFADKTKCEKPIYGENTRIDLVTLNDIMKLNFNEIADCLEATYILGVLDA